ncbi:MAG: ATP-dependent helicase, partial [Clostridium sp.]|nr:ATP-dependent helicase [Clostridium sp.]
MLKNDLINKFRKSTSGNKEVAGKRIINEGLISSFNVEKDNNEIIINSSVISENYFSEYSTKLKIDIASKDIISTHCTCQDYVNYELKRKNYCCKHLHAIFYNFLTNLEN